MLILTMGVPRSGTTLMFNIVREILEHYNIEYRSENLNNVETERFFSQYQDNANVIVHSHTVTDNLLTTLDQANVLPFFHFRDPRDVVVSEMTLHGMPFDTAIKHVSHGFSQFIRAANHAKFVLIPYEYFSTATEAYIFQVGRWLGKILGLDVVAAIKAKTSIDKATEIMNELQQDGRGVQQTASHRTLRIDQDTLITDRHIQSGKSGRWRDELSEEQQAVANDAFKALIERLGY